MDISELEELRAEKRRLETKVRNLENRLLETKGEGGPDPLKWRGQFWDGHGGQSTLWSTVLLGAENELAYATYRLFVTTRGQVGQGFCEPLSVAETNMREGGRVPSGRSFLVTTVAVQLIGGAKRDQEMIRNNATLAFDFTQTRFDIAVLSALSWRGDTGVIGLGQNSEAGTILPANCTFGVALAFGNLPRTLKQDMRVRISLGGNYVDAVSSRGFASGLRHTQW